MISSDKNEIEIDDEFDFGFSSMSEKDIFKPDDRAEKIFNKVLPFLNKLAKDAETNDYIHWPGRGPQIENFISSLRNILDNKTGK